MYNINLMVMMSLFALAVVGIAGFEVSRDSLLPDFMTEWWYDWQYSRNAQP